MSVDVFGRTLNKREGGRGPPGVGYKITTDGHFDVDNKRLCNIADPQQPHDAVNWETVLRMIQMEVKTITEITTRLTDAIDNLDIAKIKKVIEYFDHITDNKQNGTSKSS